MALKTGLSIAEILHVKTCLQRDLKLLASETLEDLLWDNNGRNFIIQKIFI